MASLAVGRGLEDLELWLAGLFSAAELAAADLLLQLSVAKGVDDEEEAASSSATTSPSPRSGCDSEDLTDTTEEEEVEEVLEGETVVEEPAVSTELDRRARKRYRLLSDLYAATSPVTSAPAAAKKKRKRSHHHHDGLGSSSDLVEATRYGGDY
jgi:hypothetical protein